MLAISIKGDGPMFSELAARDGTPEVFWKEYTAPEDCALDDRQAWVAANPGLADGIKSLEYMVAASSRAKSELGRRKDIQKSRPESAQVTRLRRT